MVSSHKEGIDPVCAGELARAIAITARSSWRRGPRYDGKEGLGFVRKSCRACPGVNVFSMIFVTDNDIGEREHLLMQVRTVFAETTKSCGRGDMVNQVQCFLVISA